jgi:23S rRNA (pseudouridine1915-N3)-methyltransferase
MKISVICVGKLKEKYLSMGVAEYAKRLGRYCSLQFIELADEKIPDNASEVLKNVIKKKEGERIIKSLKPDTYSIALAIEGCILSSEEFANKIEKLGESGHGHISFIIGGSIGLSEEVLDRVDEKISFSCMTFPHQLMRVILLEQIYRACRINNHHPYHK